MTSRDTGKTSRSDPRFRSPTTHKGSIGLLGFALPLVALLAALLSSAYATAAEKKQIFATQQACEHSGLLDPAECKYAFLNADAELDEKAPRFASRSECAREFKRCVIAGIGEVGRNGKISGVSFQPGMRAVEVSVRDGSDKNVRPILEMGDIPGLGARTVLRQYVDRSPARRAQAQARWRQLEAQKNQPPLDASGQVPRSGSDDSQSEGDASSGPGPSSVPVRADVWQEMQRDIRKYGSGD
jgi:uncharacterized protein YgiB involved in biofilm formation